METHEHIMAYYPLFEHMQNEHGLTLLESELQEIIRLSDEVKQKYNEASEGSPFQSTESKCNKHIVNGSALSKKPTRYRCLLCGRDKFTRKSPHNCNHGFRKRNIKWQPIFD